ncbi:MAG TPA: dihydrolipoamide acetyltransferase family protein [Acidimicrobiia bacterium]|nr:dihydrolipoamide acetyltransferase family protein [Acidimicrobiia bacterium]
MAKEFRLPDIGEGLTEAEIVRWLIGVGEPVKVDQPVVEVETDKAVVEIPSPYGGIVLHHGAGEGETLPVGEILVVVGEEGETWTATADPETEAWLDQVEEEMATDEGMPEAPKDSAAPIVGSISEKAVDLGPRPVLPPGSTTEGGVGGAASHKGDRVGRALGAAKALPLVRKLAKDLGVDLGQIKGSGADGRITREDVIAAAEASAGGEVELPEAPGLPPLPVDRGGERRPMSKLRRTIASNMKRSWNEIPHVTTFDEAPAGRLLASRQALESRHSVKIPLEALIIKAVLPALAQFPEFNASIDGDDLVVYSHYDIGVAVDTADGLLVAVVRAADTRTLLETAADIRRLAEASKTRKLSPDEVTGQTFTISNIGAIGGGYGTPIIPPGTTSILSVGRAADRAVAEGGKVGVAPMMPLSLSYDHRVIDGGQGRRFMAVVLENLSEPALFLAN